MFSKKEESGPSNLCSETGVDLGEEPRFRDLGDLELGGDHAITYLIIRAYSRNFNKLNILDLDAHPDLYEEYEGNRLSNARPFARIMEVNLAARLVQVGIRTLNPQVCLRGRFLRLFRGSMHLL